MADRLRIIGSLISIITGIGACSMKKVEDIKILGDEYRIPESEIAVNNVKSKNSFYLRLRGRGADFQLVYAEKNYRSFVGREHIPVVAHISDNRFSDVELIQTKAGPIVCEKLDINYKCGTILLFENAKWSLLFNRSDLAQFENIKKNALSQLISYRSK